MSELKLNLARKWRSKDFSEIIGQDLSIRMLKNSLFRDQFFPVYLFSGQRGCGKTTTARVFAAALNCENLSLFQKNPQAVIIPCLVCPSCLAMQQGHHPDFIEIDAASHTGVDNVRYIIDSATLLPQMGRKKVYLIDEAHMLSKAAFNAFLKILEEPPMSVVFILATTDPQKIIETVRSRCFQVFFKPVESTTLQDRLRKVCQAEGILYDDAGLDIIIKQTEGSVRDALNLLEQVRFSSASVSHAAVLQVLGYMDDAAMVRLFEYTLLGDPQKLLFFIAQQKWEQYSATMMWHRFLELARAVLFMKYNIPTDIFKQHHTMFGAFIGKYSAKQLLDVIEQLYKNEPLFMRTTAKHELFEMVLLQLCQRYASTNNDGGSSSLAQAPAQSAALSLGEVDNDLGEDGDDENDDDQNSDDEEFSSDEHRFKKFVGAVQALQDPLLNSIFSQAKMQQFDTQTQRLDVEFSKEFIFFQDRLGQSLPQWMPLLQKLFGSSVQFNALFTGPATAPKKIERVSEPVAIPLVKRPAPQPEPYTRSSFQSRLVKKPNPSYKPFSAEASIDTSNQALWRITHMVLQHFPGNITEIRH